jgi:hypothetical protein
VIKTHFWKKKNLTGQNFDFWTIARIAIGLKTLFILFSVTVNQNIRNLNEKRIKNAQFNLKKAQYLHYGTVFSKKGPMKYFENHIGSSKIPHH